MARRIAVGAKSNTAKSRPSALGCYLQSIPDHHLEAVANPSSLISGFFGSRSLRRGAASGLPTPDSKRDARLTASGNFERDWSPLFRLAKYSRLVKSATRRISPGDSRSLLQMIASDLAAGVPIPDDARQWLANALRSAATSRNVAASFSLTRRRKRPVGMFADRDRTILTMVRGLDAMGLYTRQDSKDGREGIFHAVGRFVRPRLSAKGVERVVNRNVARSRAI